MRRSFRFAAFMIVTVTSFVSSAAFAGAPPTRQGDVFVYADGARVRAVDPQGHAGAVQSDGSIRWSDGTALSHDTASGDTKITRADGSVAQSNSHVPEKQGNAFVYSDGTRVRATDPSGKPGVAKPDGSIVYGDGTRVSHDTASGDTKIFHADGTVDVVSRNAPTRGTDGNFGWSDGTRVRGSDPNGNPGKIMPDGSILYGDGTRASHDVASGDTKFVSPDGTVRLVNPATGTDKTTSPGASGQNVPGQQTGKPQTASPQPNNNSNNSNANHSSSNNSNNSNASNSNTSKDKDKDTAKDKEKPAKEPVDKEKPSGKGRQVQDYGVTGAGGGPRVSGVPTSTDPSPEGSSGKGRPTLTGPGAAFGPGARTEGGGGRAPGAGSFVRLPPNALVINPNPYMAGGPATPKTIDPQIGRR